jgi:hypothetical protein
MSQERLNKSTRTLRSDDTGIIDVSCGRCGWTYAAEPVSTLMDLVHGENVRCCERCSESLEGVPLRLGPSGSPTSSDVASTSASAVVDRRLAIIFRICLVGGGVWACNKGFVPSRHRYPAVEALKRWQEDVERYRQLPPPAEDPRVREAIEEIRQWPSEGDE